MPLQINCLTQFLKTRQGIRAQLVRTDEALGQLVLVFALDEDAEVDDHALGGALDQVHHRAGRVAAADVDVDLEVRLLSVSERSISDHENQAYGEVESGTSRLVARSQSVATIR